ncbi:Threonine aspartase [Trichinella pseudospiralis]
MLYFVAASCRTFEKNTVFQFLIFIQFFGSSDKTMMDDMFVAVHAGAGYYPRKQRDKILRCLQKACKVALNEMKKGKSSLHACTQATIIIEDCPLTNAGLGSNLTLNETVECDAGLMDGKTMNFAGVGALQGVKNPISLAKSLLDAQNQRQDGEQLVQPMLLVSDGALQYAKSVGVETVDFKDMIVENSVQTFRKNLSNLIPAYCLLHLVRVEAYYLKHQVELVRLRCTVVAVGLKHSISTVVVRLVAVDAVSI